MAHRAALLFALAAAAAVTSAVPGVGEPLHPHSPTPVIISSDVATGLVGGWRGGPSDVDERREPRAFLGTHINDMVNPYEDYRRDR